MTTGPGVGVVPQTGCTRALPLVLSEAPAAVTDPATAPAAVSAAPTVSGCPTVRPGTVASVNCLLAKQAGRHQHMLLHLSSQLLGQEEMTWCTDFRLHDKSRTAADHHDRMYNIVIRSSGCRLDELGVLASGKNTTAPVEVHVEAADGEGRRHADCGRREVGRQIWRLHWEAAAAHEEAAAQVASRRHLHRPSSRIWTRVMTKVALYVAGFSELEAFETAAHGHCWQFEACTVH